MSESWNVKIEVYGKEFTIKTSEDPETTREYARFIDERMKDISHKTGTFDPARISTLALLQITHELFALKGQMESDEKEFAARTKSLLRKFDSIIHQKGIQGELTQE